jgi:hypothetical protein
VEAQRIAEQIGHEHIRTLVIDSSRDTAGGQLPGAGVLATQAMFGGFGFNACLDLAERSGGEYLGLYDLSQGAIVAGVEKTLRGR